MQPESKARWLSQSSTKTKIENRQIENLHASFGIKERRSFVKLHIPVHSFYPKGLTLSFFPSTGSHFQDTGRFSKLAYLGMKLVHWKKFQKLYIHSLFTPRGRNWAYLRSTGSGFRDIDQFSKLQYLDMQLFYWRKFQKLHIYSLSPRVRNWAYFRSTCPGFRDIGPFSTLPYLGMKLGHGQKFQKLHIYSLFTPGGRN